MASSLINSTMIGLQMVQRGLTMTSNNITNAAVDGYSRQGLELSLSGDSHDGVIRRQYDDFLGKSVISSTGLSTEADTYKSLTGQLQQLVADPATSLGKVTDDFFAAANDLASSPASLPSRTAFIQSADNLAARYQSANDRINFLKEQTWGVVQNDITQVNNLATSIADLNRQIKVASSDPLIDPPNAMIDQRQKLLEKLSTLTTVKTFQGTDGTFSVITGKGQTLIQGEQASKWVLRGTLNEPDIRLYAAGRNPDATDKAGKLLDPGLSITDQQAGGEIGAHLKFKADLDNAQSLLDQQAFGLATLVNTQMQAGKDLKGNAGISLFSIKDPASNSGAALTSSKGAAGVIKLAYSDPTLVAAATTGAAGDPVVGDGSNLSNVLAFQNSNSVITLKDGTLDVKTSVSGAYAYFAAKLANTAAAAETDSTAKSNLLNDAVSRSKIVSGVNLDEEAAHLMMYQQTYKAVAQLLPAMTSMFDSLLAATRG